MYRKFKVANISLLEGTLVVDTRNISKFEKHYNVVVEKIENDLFSVIGDKPEIVINSKMLSDTESIKPYNVCDEYLFESKPFLGIFGKSKTKIKEGFIELKKRTPITYTTNKIIIIEKENE